MNLLQITGIGRTFFTIISIVAVCISCDNSTPYPQEARNEDVPTNGHVSMKISPSLVPDRVDQPMSESTPASREHDCQSKAWNRMEVEIEKLNQKLVYDISTMKDINLELYWKVSMSSKKRIFAIFTSEGVTASQGQFMCFIEAICCRQSVYQEEGKYICLIKKDDRNAPTICGVQYFDNSTEPENITATSKKPLFAPVNDKKEYFQITY